MSLKKTSSSPGRTWYLKLVFSRVLLPSSFPFLQYVSGTSRLPTCRRHPKISIDLMEVGHTKFSPDRHFGILKKKLRQKGAQSNLDLIDEYGIVETSSADNHVVTYRDPGLDQENFS